MRVTTPLDLLSSTPTATLNFLGHRKLPDANGSAISGTIATEECQFTE